MEEIDKGFSSALLRLPVPQPVVDTKYLDKNDVMVSEVRSVKQAELDFVSYRYHNETSLTRKSIAVLRDIILLQLIIRS